MKKILTILLSLCFCSLCCLPTGAVPETCTANQTYSDASESSDDDISQQVAQIMQNYFDNPDLAKNELSNLDVTLFNDPQIVTYGNTRGLDPTDYQLTLFSYGRGGSKNVYLQWSLSANKTEWFPGPLDYVSIEWNTTFASYYSSTGDGVYSTVQGTETGIVLFNVQDNDLKKGEYTYGYVQVAPKANGWMEYGSKFVHTYSKILIGGSATYAFNPSVSVTANGDLSLNLDHTMGVTISVSSNTEKWQIWTDNAINMSTDNYIENPYDP